MNLHCKEGMKIKMESLVSILSQIDESWQVLKGGSLCVIVEMYPLEGPHLKTDDLMLESVYGSLNKVLRKIFNLFIWEIRIKARQIDWILLQDRNIVTWSLLIYLRTAICELLGRWNRSRLDSPPQCTQITVHCHSKGQITGSILPPWKILIKSHLASRSLWGVCMWLSVQTNGNHHTNSVAKEVKLTPVGPSEVMVTASSGSPVRQGQVVKITVGYSGPNRPVQVVQQMYQLWLSQPVVDTDITATLTHRDVIG